MPLASWGILAPLLLFFCVSAPVRAGEIKGRVVDRGTLDEQGKAKGISGVQVSVYDGKRLVGTASTDARGQYRIRKAPTRCKLVYRAKGGFPSSVTRVYSIAPSDSGFFDLALDRSPKAEDALEYYRGVARGMLALPIHPAFFREASDSVFTMGGAFVDGDSSADYRTAMMELLWEEFLAQDRPLIVRYHLAAALKPVLDSLGSGGLRDLDRYLDADPSAIEAYVADIKSAFKDPKLIPSPKEVRKAGLPLNLAAGLAARNLAVSGLNKRRKDQFRARWKKTWGKELAEPGEEASPEPFQPEAAVERLAETRPQSSTAQFLKGRALYVGREFGVAAEALALANKLRPGVFPAARYLEALAYMELGRESEALGRFQALREAPNPVWKAKAYYGLGVINEKEKRHAEAATDLWRSIRLVQSPEAVFLLAEVSFHLNDNTEAEKLLEGMVARNSGEHRARYWLGRYAEKREQVGVAEDHFRRAWEASPAPEYAEALGRISASREEWVQALKILEPIKAKLSPEGRERYADCLLQTGRGRDAAREYAAAYAAKPTAPMLGRYAEALLQTGRVEEAQAAVAAYKDQTHPAVRLAQAKVSMRLGDIPKSRLILEDLVKREENNPELHFLVGQGYFQEHAYGKARKEFDQSLRYRADYLDAVYFSGLALIKTGRPEEARNFFNELAQRASPDWRAKGFAGVGLSFAAQQKPEAADNYYARSIAALPTAEALALLALSKRRLGGPEHWESEARRAFELDNRLPKAVQAMGEVLLHHGKKSQALKLFQRAMEHSPGSCDILAGLAKCQYLTGQYQASRSTSASAISQCPGEADPFYYAAVTSDKLRNRKEAEDYFKAYRKAGGDEELLPPDYR